MIANETISNKFFKADIRVVLSSLWLFVVINIFFRDIHEFVKADVINQILDGSLYGNEVSDGLLLIGGVAAVLTASMVLFSAILRRNYNRKLNLYITPILALAMITNGFTDPDDLLHLVVESIAMIFIFVIALRWKSS